MKGFTLIEILLVVGFIALLSIGIFMTYNKVQTSGAANTESQNITTLQAGIKNLYAGQTDYSTITPAILLNGWVVPDSMRSPSGAAATNIVNSFSSTVAIAPYTYNGGAANNAFDITYPGIPSDICSKLVTLVGNNFVKVVVGGTTVKDNSVGNYVVDPAATTTGCNSASAGVTVDFIGN